MKNFKAFSLTEVIISLTLLGIIAAIVVPSTIKNSVTKTNRSKMQKAITTYNKALEQYYMTDYNDYSAKYNAMKSARSAELANYPITGVTSAQRTANNVMRREISSRYTTEQNNLKAEFTSKFASYYKVNKTATSNGTTYYKTNDGLWWYFGSDPAMLSVIVTFDAIKEKRGNEEIAYTLDELQKLASSKDEKAFYLIAQKKSFMITPAINILAPGSINNQIDTILNDMSNVNNYAYMWKLYNYINNVKNADMADVYCTGSYNGSCCKDTTGTCMSFSTPSTYYEVMYTDDVYISKLEQYDKTTGKLIEIVDEETRQMKIFNDDGTEVCYTLKNWNTSKWNGNRGDWYRSSTPDPSCKF